MIASTSPLSRLYLRHSLVVVLFAFLKFSKFAFAGDPELIVLLEDRNYCLTATNPRVNSAVTVGRCDRNNRFQYWRFDNRGLWCTETEPDLCVVVPTPSRPREGDRLVLTRRSRNPDHDWFYNDSRDKELQIRRSTTLCVTYNSRLAAGTAAIMSRCNGRLSQAWDFQFDTHDKPGDNWKLIRMHQSRHLCIGVSRNIVEANRNLVVTGCSASDRTQQWRFTDDGTWRPRLDTNLCVNVDRVRPDEIPFLFSCDRANNRRWHYNENGQRDITPVSDSSLCAARDNQDQLRLFSNCFNGGVFPENRQWDFVEAN